VLRSVHRSRGPELRAAVADAAAAQRYRLRVHHRRPEAAHHDQCARGAAAFLDPSIVQGAPANQQLRAIKLALAAYRPHGPHHHPRSRWRHCVTHTRNLCRYSRSSRSESSPMVCTDEQRQHGARAAAREPEEVARPGALRGKGSRLMTSCAIHSQPCSSADASGHPLRLDLPHSVEAQTRNLIQTQAVRLCILPRSESSPGQISLSGRRSAT